MQESEFKTANRIFFLSVPPGVFVDAARGASGAASSEYEYKLCAGIHFILCAYRFWGSHGAYGFSFPTWESKVACGAWSSDRVASAPEHLFFGVSCCIYRGTTPRVDWNDLAMTAAAVRAVLVAAWQLH